MKYVVVCALLMLSMRSIANEQQLDIRIEDSVLWRFVVDNDSYELFLKYQYDWETPDYLFDWGVILPLPQVKLMAGNVKASGALKLTEHLLGYGRNSSYTHSAGTIELADGLTPTDAYGLYATFYPFEIPIAIVAGGTIDERTQQVVVGTTLNIQERLSIESWNTITLLNPVDNESATTESWFASKYETHPHRFNNSSLHLLLDQPGLDIAMHGVIQYGPWLAPQGSAALHITAGAKPHYGSVKGGWGSLLLLDTSGELSKRIWLVDGGYEYIPSQHFEFAVAYQAIGYSDPQNLQSISYINTQWVQQYRFALTGGLVFEPNQQQEHHTSTHNEQSYELWLRPSGTVDYKTDKRTGNQYQTRLYADAEIELELLTPLIATTLGGSHRWQWHDDNQTGRRILCEIGIAGDTLELTGSMRWDAENAVFSPATATVTLEYSQSLVDWFVKMQLTQFPLTTASFIDDSVFSTGFTVGW